MPVPRVGFCNPALEACAIALEAHSNTRFRAKVVEGIVAEQQNSDRRSVCPKCWYLQLGFAILLCAIAREARSNTHFRAKVAQDSGRVTKLGPKVCLFLRRYLKLGFAILCAQSVLKHSV